MFKVSRIIFLAILISLVSIAILCNHLYAQTEPMPPPAVLFEETDNTYSLDYFVPYAKSIVTNYVYENGGIAIRVFQEEVTNGGTTAKMSYANASSIKSIQIVVNLHDGRRYTQNPIRFKLNRMYLPLITKDENKIKDIDAGHPGTLYIYPSRIQLIVDIDGYDVLVVRLYKPDGTQYYETITNNSIDSVIPTSIPFGRIYGYVFNTQTLEVRTIDFMINNFGATNE